MKIKLFFLITIITLYLDKNYSTESANHLKNLLSKAGRDFLQKTYGDDIHNTLLYKNEFDCDKLEDYVDLFEEDDLELKKKIKNTSRHYACLHNNFKTNITDLSLHEILAYLKPQSASLPIKKTTLAELLKNIKNKIQDENFIEQANKVILINCQQNNIEDLNVDKDNFIYFFCLMYINSNYSDSNQKTNLGGMNQAHDILKNFFNTDEFTIITNINIGLLIHELNKAREFKTLFSTNSHPSKQEIMKFMEDHEFDTKNDLEWVKEIATE
jgi:hypothetical protein